MKKQGQLLVVIFSILTLFSCSISSSGDDAPTIEEPRTFKVTEITNTAGFSARFAHTSVMFNYKIWVISGFGSSINNEIWNSPDGLTWSQVTTEITFPERVYHTSVLFENKV